MLFAHEAHAQQKDELERIASSSLSEVVNLWVEEEDIDCRIEHLFGAIIESGSIDQENFSRDKLLRVIHRHGLEFHMVNNDIVDRISESEDFDHLRPAIALSIAETRKAAAVRLLQAGVPKVSVTGGTIKMKVFLSQNKPAARVNILTNANFFGTKKINPVLEFLSNIFCPWRQKAPRHRSFPRSNACRFADQDREKIGDLKVNLPSQKSPPNDNRLSEVTIDLNCE